MRREEKRVVTGFESVVDWNRQQTGEGGRGGGRGVEGASKNHF